MTARQRKAAKAARAAARLGRAKKIVKKKRIPNDPMPAVPPPSPRRKLPFSELAMLTAKKATKSPFAFPAFPKISMPPGARGRGRVDTLAMDQQIIEVNAWAAQNTYNGAFANGAGFLGYPYLAELSQIPEYRKIVETTAMHMTRKFIKLQSVGNDTEGEGKADKIKQINDAIEDFRLRDVFRKSVEVDGYFGRAHLYIDFGEPADPKELTTSIGNGRDDLSRLKFKGKKGPKLKRFDVIEPVWTYPTNYNSNNPLNVQDWYNPQTWFVLGKEIHHTRLLRMVAHEVPDLLKPSYSFGGLSMTQMAKPYVDNWLRTRQAVADAIWSFSTSGVLTDMSTMMMGQGEDLLSRVNVFNNFKNNNGMMLLNKDTEEFFQINTPLGTLDKLQAQAQEHMASVSSIPLVFLLGITPSGLNASSEGEIRAFYDFIQAMQEKFFKEPLTRAIDFIQLSLFGDIDPEITFVFESLWSMDDKALADVDKTRAETDDLRINGGVISPLEARKAVAVTADTPYANLDVSVLPVPPGGGGEEIGGKGLDPGEPQGGEEDNGPKPVDGAEPREEDDNPFAQDAAFEEGKHRRGQPGNAGQFGGGGGGNSPATSHNVVEHNETRGVWHVKHKGEYVKGKKDVKAFMSPEVAQKFADTYTGEEAAPAIKEKKEYKGPGISSGEGFKQITTLAEYLDIAKRTETELSDEDKAALNHYTSPAYKPLNKALRSGKELSPETQKIVDTLDRVISESHLPEPLTLFRGLRGSQTREMLDALMPGDTLTDKGFVSTSLSNSVSKDQTEGGKRSNMVIRAPKGANAALPGEHSYNKSTAETGHDYDNALEAVLPRGSQFKFIGKKGANYEFELVTNKGAAQDEGPWEEGKHPRGQPGNAGQFGPGGGGGGPPAPSVNQVSAQKLLNKPAGISGKYRQGIQDLLKDASVDAETKTKLKHKVIESYKAKKDQLVKMNGEPAKINSITGKIQKLTQALGTGAGGPGPAGHEDQDEDGNPKPTNEKYQIDKSKASPDKFIIKQGEKVLGNNGQFGQNIPTKKFASEAEAKAFFKTLDDFAELEKKTNAAQAEANAKAAADLQKSQEENKEKNAGFMKELGITETEAAGFNALVKMHDTADGSGDLIEKFKAYENKAKKFSYPITGFQYALIRDYINGGYISINQALRGITPLTPDQHVYTRLMNKALDKLPKYTGIVKRGTTLSAEQIANYKVGHVVEEKSFTSSSNSGAEFKGNVKYTIKANGHRTADFSKGTNQGEGEVLFKAHTFFLVHKVETKGNVTHIEMEEVEGHG